MLEFFGPQIVPPTEKSAKYVLIIKIVTACQLFIAILDMIARNSFLREGIFGLFFTILLLFIAHKLSYQAIIIYCFASLFFTVVFLVYILTIAQQGTMKERIGAKWEEYYLGVACISFVFYFFNSIFFFYPYREFKTIQFMENTVFNEMMMNSEAERNLQEIYDVKYTLDYGHNEPDKDRKVKGTFEVLKGQGVKIG